MKHILFLSRVLLASVLVVSPVKAQSPSDRNLSYNPALPQTSSPSQTSPVDLAFLSYRGYLKSQGVDGYGALLTGYTSGRITPKAIVQAAINAHLVSASVLNDRGYLSALDSTIRDFEMH
ncbi:MAG: hypothetical protein KME10_12355 [Plectolyngbya sp. WJT66-NPBG17]|jgi:hypothetical protein|nr:hypothetical protein [Plectolyngbya sp. WJT66-NPBG17]